MIVDLEKYREWLEWKRSINRSDIESIEWRLNGKPVEIPDGAYDDFAFMGLSNTDFPALYLGEEGVRVTAMTLEKKP